MNWPVGLVVVSTQGWGEKIHILDINYISYCDGKIVDCVGYDYSKCFPLKNGEMIVVQSFFEGCIHFLDLSLNFAINIMGSNWTSLKFDFSFTLKF